MRSHFICKRKRLPRALRRVGLLLLVACAVSPLPARASDFMSGVPEATPFAKARHAEPGGREVLKSAVGKGRIAEQSARGKLLARRAALTDARRLLAHQSGRSRVNAHYIAREWTEGNYYCVEVVVPQRK